MLSASILLAAIASGSAHAAQYACEVDLVSGTTNCNGVDIAASISGSQAVLTLDAGGPGQYRRADVFAYVCDPTGWVLHLADSPTNDGYGGDGSTTDHDAEAHMTDGSFSFYGAMDWFHGSTMPKSIVRDQVPTSGCSWVRMAASHPTMSPSSTVEFEPDGGGLTTVTTAFGPKLGYMACAAAGSPQRSVNCDYEDAGLADAFRWYVGLNQVVTGGRTGSGLEYACVIMDTDPNGGVADAHACADVSLATNP